MFWFQFGWLIAVSLSAEVKGESFAEKLLHERNTRKIVIDPRTGKAWYNFDEEFALAPNSFLHESEVKKDGNGGSLNNSPQNNARLPTEGQAWLPLSEGFRGHVGAVENIDEQSFIENSRGPWESQIDRAFNRGTGPFDSSTDATDPDALPPNEDAQLRFSSSRAVGNDGGSSISTNSRSFSSSHSSSSSSQTRAAGQLQNQGQSSGFSGGQSDQNGGQTYQNGQQNRQQSTNLGFNHQRSRPSPSSNSRDDQYDGGSDQVPVAPSAISDSNNQAVNNAQSLNYRTNGQNHQSASTQSRNSAFYSSQTSKVSSNYQSGSSVQSGQQPASQHLAPSPQGKSGGLSHSILTNSQQSQTSSYTGTNKPAAPSSTSQQTGYSSVIETNQSTGEYTGQVDQFGRANQPNQQQAAPSPQSQPGSKSQGSYNGAAGQEQGHIPAGPLPQVQYAAQPKTAPSPLTHDANYAAKSNERQSSQQQITQSYLSSNSQATNKHQNSQNIQAESYSTNHQSSGQQQIASQSHSPSYTSNSQVSSQGQNSRTSQTGAYSSDVQSQQQQTNAAAQSGTQHYSSNTFTNSQVTSQNQNAQNLDSGSYTLNKQQIAVTPQNGYSNSEQSRQAERNQPTQQQVAPSSQSGAQTYSSSNIANSQVTSQNQNSRNFQTTQNQGHSGGYSGDGTGSNRPAQKQVAPSPQDQTNLPGNSQSYGSNSQTSQQNSSGVAPATAPKDVYAGVNSQSSFTSNYPNTQVNEAPGPVPAPSPNAYESRTSSSQLASKQQTSISYQTSENGKVQPSRQQLAPSPQSTQSQTQYRDSQTSSETQSQSQTQTGIYNQGNNRPSQEHRAPSPTSGKNIESQTSTSRNGYELHYETDTFGQKAGNAQSTAEAAAPSVQTSYSISALNQAYNGRGTTTAITSQTQPQPNAYNQTSSAGTQEKQEFQNTLPGGHQQFITVYNNGHPSGTGASAGSSSVTNQQQFIVLFLTPDGLKLENGDNPPAEIIREIAGEFFHEANGRQGPGASNNYGQQTGGQKETGHATRPPSTSPIGDGYEAGSTNLPAPVAPAPITREDEYPSIETIMEEDSYNQAPASTPSYNNINRTPSSPATAPAPLGGTPAQVDAYGAPRPSATGPAAITAPVAPQLSGYQTSGASQPTTAPRTVSGQQFVSGAVYTNNNAGTGVGRSRNNGNLFIFQPHLSSAQVNGGGARYNGNPGFSGGDSRYSGSPRSSGGGSRYNGSPGFSGGDSRYSGSPGSSGGGSRYNEGSGSSGGGSRNSGGSAFNSAYSNQQYQPQPSSAFQSHNINFGRPLPMAKPASNYGNVIPAPAPAPWSYPSFGPIQQGASTSYGTRPAQPQTSPTQQGVSISYATGPAQPQTIPQATYPQQQPSAGYGGSSGSSNPGVVQPSGYNSPTKPRAAALRESVINNSQRRITMQRAAAARLRQRQRASVIRDEPQQNRPSTVKVESNQPANRPQLSGSVVVTRKAEWTEWSSWSECNSLRRRSRTRQCKFGFSVISEGCVGNSSEVDMCEK